MIPWTTDSGTQELARPYRHLPLSDIPTAPMHPVFDMRPVVTRTRYVVRRPLLRRWQRLLHRRAIEDRRPLRAAVDDAFGPLVTLAMLTLVALVNYWLADGFITWQGWQQLEGQP